MSGSVTTAQLEGPSSGTCSCCRETRDELIALRKAVEELKATVLRLSSVNENSSTTRPTVQLSSEKRLIRPPRRQRRGLPEDDDHQKLESAATSRPGKKKVPSSGKRKVWGTRKQINANTIRQTIAKSTSLTEDSISVKRKFSLSNGKETRWWFVISGDESTLATLEREWGVIQQKSNWKLLPCLVFDNSPDAQPVHESDSASPPLTQIPVSLSISAPCSLLNNPATPVVEPNGSSD